MIEISCVIIDVEIIYFVFYSDKKREWIHESDCLYVRHIKPKIQTMLLANL
jgi:hypothetical protein